MIRPSRFSSSLLAVCLLAVCLPTLFACSPTPEQSMEVDGVTVGVRTEPSPAKLGDNDFLWFVKADGKAVTDAKVRFRMFMPGMPMSTDNTWRPSTHDKAGRYKGRGDFSMGGDWRVVVTVTGLRTEPVRAEFPYTIEWKLD